MNTTPEYPITLQVCQDTLAVCYLPPSAKIPDWATLGNDTFTSITKTPEELSIVCDQTLVPADIKAERNWRLLKIKGQLDFALVGILKRVITPLSENGISIYAISTYNTDYILIQEKYFANALTLLQAFFTIENA